MWDLNGRWNWGKSYLHLMFIPKELPIIMVSFLNFVKAVSLEI